MTKSRLVLQNAEPGDFFCGFTYFIYVSKNKGARKQGGIKKMTKEEIIGGLQFTVDMFLFDPSTGETYKEPRNDMDKTTIDACKGAIELLKQSSDEAMGVKKLLGIIHKEGVETEVFKALSTWLVNEREAQIRELRQHFQNNERPKKETKKTKKVETVVEIPKEIYERQAWLLNKTIDGTLPLKEPEANDVER